MVQEYEHYVEKLDIGEAELRSRRSYFALEEADLERLASLRWFADRYVHEIIDALYQHILAHEEARRVFPDAASIERAQRAQREYFHGLFSGRCDLEYVRNRVRIGALHRQRGVASRLFLGAYARYQALIHDRLARELEDPAELRLAQQSVAKLLSFDAALAMDAYIQSHQEAVERHQAAVRELSTPAIEVHERILLLPLIGSLDTQRAEQIMETVLSKVVEVQAYVVIMDIAGVPVVDTQVADHLLQTTEAARLLGADSILTSISPHVAKTVVRLNLDIEAMYTRSVLSDGLDLALEIVEERRRDRRARPERAEPKVDGDGSRRRRR